MRYFMHQGSFDFPFPFEDHSTNALLVINPETEEATQVTIARDRLETDEQLDDYLKRQYGILAKKIPGYTEISRKTIPVGETGLEAVIMEVRFKDSGYTISQLHGVIIMPNKIDILVANIVIPGPSTEAHKDMWDNFISSFNVAEPQ